jgi:hypothetical protein
VRFGLDEPAVIVIDDCGRLHAEGAAPVPSFHVIAAKIG